MYAPYKDDLKKSRLTLNAVAMIAQQLKLINEEVDFDSYDPTNPTLQRERINVNQIQGLVELSNIGSHRKRWL